MGHNIKKETYVNADDKTTKALTFDLLDHLYSKLDETAETQIKQVETCNRRFTKIEGGKKRDTAVSAASGFGGGFVAVAATWLKRYFAG